MLIPLFVGKVSPSEGAFAHTGQFRICFEEIAVVKEIKMHDIGKVIECSMSRGNHQRGIDSCPIRRHYLYRVQFSGSHFSIVQL